MARHIPSTLRKLTCMNISPKFREVTKIIEESIQPLKPGEILVKNRYLGINASDINFTAGRYDPSVKAPFDVGFEALGEIVRVGEGVNNMSLGQPVMYCINGAFRDYNVMKAKWAMKVPAVDAKFLSFTLSGPTAAVSFDKLGDLKKGETVLVTAAAGGTGQFAVQLAKMAGCHVIGTCSSEKKVEFLKKIGCDRPVNYKKEELKKVLMKEYKGGVDVVYESVGGEMFDTCLNSLRTGGRLIVIGFITGYDTELGFKPSRTMASLPVRLLQKSASVRGFFLPHFPVEWNQAGVRMASMCNDGKLQSYVDFGNTADKGPFQGLEQVADAVEYLYTSSNVGKVVVELPDQTTQSKL